MERIQKTGIPPHMNKLKIQQMILFFVYLLGAISHQESFLLLMTLVISSSI